MSSAKTSSIARALATDGDELALFHRTLAEFCRADVPLPKAFHMLQGDLRRGRFRDGVAEMAAEVESGVPLGEAYARRKQAFPALYCALVEIGMVSGDLPGVLDEISRDAAQRARFADRIRRALAYPIVAAAFVLGLGGLLLVLVGPTLWNFPVEVGLSWPIPYAIGALGFLVLMVLAVFLFGWARSPLDKAGRRSFRFPVIGRIRLYAAKASLLSTLGLLLRRGVPLPTALTLASEACEDDAVANALAAVARKAGGGMSLHDALAEAGVLEPTLLWLVEAAEGSKETPRALDDIGAVYARRLERAIDRLATVVTPVAELVIGVVVFFFAYTFLIPLVQFSAEMFRL